MTDSMFDEIIETHVAPDGTVEATLVNDTAQEMESAVAEMTKAWRDFRDADVEAPHHVTVTNGGRR
jgi:hypothetical protein